MAVCEKGNVFSWGCSDGCQLGLSEEQLANFENISLGISIPVLVLQNQDIISVSAGTAHSLALTKDGDVYAWGFNNYGQLGLGFSGEDFEPGTGNAGSIVYTPRKIEALEGLGVREIICGSTFSMFISNTHELFACGINDLG